MESAERRAREDVRNRTKTTFIFRKRNRYFAFGYDSYDIALLLNNPSSTWQFKFTGMSGELSYKGGSLSRKSLKTEISKGFFKATGY